MFTFMLRVSVLGGVLVLLAACGAAGADDKKDEKAVELKVGDTEG